MTAVRTSGTQIDHYKIVRKLGHGGMNHVYLASDTDNQQVIVLKFPNDELIDDLTAYERYKREAHIGNRLYHPNVQKVLNTDEKRTGDYLVIEYIEGRALRSVIKDCTPDPLPPTEALNIIRQICDALVYCHEKGVLHRDIKPENIMVQDDGSIKIIDFGIALLEGARRVTWSGLPDILGTPDYISPEQLKGECDNVSSDIYAVGVMLYEMLCGHTPFTGENIFAIMNQKLTQDPPSILDANSRLSPELATIVMHAIQRHQDKRYKTMKELLHDLENLEGINIVPSGPKVPQHSKKIVPFSKFSNRFPLALAGIIL